MARTLRIEFAGAVHHVMARGQRRGPIVQDEEDRGRWMETVEEAVTRSGWRLLAYALMGNHYHLLIETPQPTLVSGMKWLQGTYATRYRLRHCLVGSVFAGRYKALLIEPDNRHLGTVMDYIHLNGWRSGQATLSRGLELTPWCSLRWYSLERRKRPAWLAVSEGLRWHDLPDTAAGRRRFIERIEERARVGTRHDDERRERELEWKAAMRRGWHFGSAGFREAVIERAKALLGRQKDPSQVESEVRREVGEAEALRLLQKASARWRWREGDLLGKPKGDPQKIALGWFIRHRTGVPLAWIQSHLHTGATAATSRLLAGAAKAAAARPPRNPVLRWIAELEQISK